MGMEWAPMRKASVWLLRGQQRRSFASRVTLATFASMHGPSPECTRLLIPVRTTGLSSLVAVDRDARLHVRDEILRRWGEFGSAAGSVF